MPTAATFIPTFTAITLLLGGFNELSVRLTLVGIFAITLHTAVTPIDLNLYPNFDDYHPSQSPFRDYVLVFGLVSLMLIALFSRIRPLLLFLGRVTWRALQVCLRSCGLVGRQAGTPLGHSVLHVQDTVADHDVRSTPHLPRSSPSPSRTFTSQWTATASTLAVGSPASITPRAGHREVTDSSETAALKARVSQLETALEELSRRMDILSAGGKDADTTLGITTTVVTKSPPAHTPPPLNLNTALPPPTLPSPSPSPVDPNSTPLAELKPANATIDAREHLKSLVESLMEGTRQTDQLIHRMRNILAEADTTDGTMPEADQGEESAPPVLLTSRSTHILLTEHLHPSFTDPPLAPSPYPSPYPSPSTRPDQPLWTPTICRVRNTPPPPSAVNQFDEMANGSPGTPEFNLTQDFLDLSEAPCSTPLRSAKEAEQSIPSSFSAVLEADFGSQHTLVKPTSKRFKEVDARVNRATPIPGKIPPRNPTYARNLIARLRERSLKSPYPSPSSALVESSPDSRRNAKGKGKTGRTLEGMLDWLAERRRRRSISPDTCPLHRDYQG